MKLIIALVAGAAALAASSAALAGDAGVASTLQSFAKAFNAGDIKTAKALHVARPTIIDEVGPHLWTGPAAFDHWLADLTKSEAAEGKTGGVVAIGAPTREVISGDHAYVVTPAAYSFKQKGVAMREDPAQFTFVLVKTKPGWKILSWTWTGPEAKPAK